MPRICSLNGLIWCLLLPATKIENGQYPVYMMLKTARAQAFCIHDLF